MALPERLLVPTDFSECADLALTTARFLTELMQAQAWVAHVVPRDFAAVLEETGALAHLEEKLHKRLDSLNIPLAQVPRDCREVRVADSVEDGIKELAEEHKAQLIVLGTHGRRGLDLPNYGSIAAKVVHASNCSVLTVGQIAGARGLERLQSVMVAADLTEGTEHLVRYATELARFADAKLVIAHVVDDSLTRAYDVPLDPEALSNYLDQTRRSEMLEKIAHVAASGVTFELQVSHGDPAQVLIDSAEKHAADMILLSRPRRDTAVGSVADRVLRGAHCPVWVVNEGAHP